MPETTKTTKTLVETAATLAGATLTTTVPTKAVTGAKKKLYKSENTEQWETIAIGDFVLFLYHVQVISSANGWFASKPTVQKQFLQFCETAGLLSKFETAHGTADIGFLLNHTGFLRYETRGKYRFKNFALYHYRNDKLDILDENCKNSDVQVETNNKTDLIKEKIERVYLEVDENAKVTILEYQGTKIYSHDDNFKISNFGCYICQRNFASPDELEEHVLTHGEESDFESLKAFKKSKEPWITLSYKLCKHSMYYRFTLENNHPLSSITIDKIIIVLTRTMNYVHNTLVPYVLNGGKDTFYVNVQQFALHVEHPIVIVFHQTNYKAMHIVEQHHLMRTDVVPTVSVGLNPYRLNSNITFKAKMTLLQYLPPTDIFQALQDDDAVKRLCQLSYEFDNFINNGRVLTANNISKVLTVLLQIEDRHALLEYRKFTRRGVKLHQFGSEYSVRIHHGFCAMERILKPFDEILLMPDQTDNNDDMDTFIKCMDCENDKEWANKKYYRGIVQAVHTGRVTFECDSKIPEKNYMVTFRPMRHTLRYQYRALELLDHSVQQNVRRILFPMPMHRSEISLSNITFLNKYVGENPEQAEAVCRIISGVPKEAPFIIFGPPGTGKTTTIIEAILQLYLHDTDVKILITAGSNSACDEIAIRLIRALDDMKEHKNALVRIYSRSCEDRMQNINELLLEHSNMYSTHFYPNIDVLHEYRIIVCTLSLVGKLSTGRFGKNLRGNGIFTHVFIDEAASITEPEALVAIVAIHSPHCSLILSGDHKQLGPVLQSSLAEELGLGISLMERLLKRDCYAIEMNGTYNHSIQIRLCRNYRSHPVIVNLYSALFYESKLIALANSEKVQLCEKWCRAPNPQYPIIFHAAFGSVTREENSTSFYNTRELDVVLDYVKDLIFFGINGKKIMQNDIGIISPYKKQYLRIREELNLRKWYAIEVGSVEIFQGKEKPIIIISFVRSFSSSLGFLDNPKRLNVMLSRPKSLLIMIGNPKTLSLNKNFKHVIDECRKHNTLNAECDFRKPQLKQDQGEQDSAIEKKTNVKKKEYEKKEQEKQKMPQNRKDTINDTGDMQKQKLKEQSLRKAMKKSVKPVSQQKQRSHAETFMENILTKEVTYTHSYPATSGESEAIMENILTKGAVYTNFYLATPGESEENALATAKNTEKESTSISRFLQLEQEVHEKMRRLNMKPPPTTTVNTLTQDNDRTNDVQPKSMPKPVTNSFGLNSDGHTITSTQSMRAAATPASNSRNALSSDNRVHVPPNSTPNPNTNSFGLRSVGSTVTSTQPMGAATTQASNNGNTLSSNIPKSTPNSNTNSFGLRSVGPTVTSTQPMRAAAQTRGANTSFEFINLADVPTANQSQLRTVNPANSMRPQLVHTTDKYGNNLSQMRTTTPTTPISREQNSNRTIFGYSTESPSPIVYTHLNMPIKKEKKSNCVIA